MCDHPSGWPKPGRSFIVVRSGGAVAPVGASCPSYPPPRGRVGGGGRQWETWNEIPVARGRLHVGRNDIGRSGPRPRGETRGQTRNQGGRTAATRPRGGAEQVLPVPYRCDVPRPAPGPPGLGVDDLPHDRPRRAVDAGGNQVDGRLSRRGVRRSRQARGRAALTFSDGE